VTSDDLRKYKSSLPTQMVFEDLCIRVQLQQGSAGVIFSSFLGNLAAEAKALSCFCTASATFSSQSPLTDVQVINQLQDADQILSSNWLPDVVVHS
jgi:hypothetical protein